MQIDSFVGLVVEVAAVRLGGVLQCVGSHPDVSVATSAVGRDGSTLEPDLLPVTGEVAPPVARQVPFADVAGLLTQRSHVIRQRRGAER